MEKNIVHQTHESQNIPPSSLEDEKNVIQDEKKVIQDEKKNTPRVHPYKLGWKRSEKDERDFPFKSSFLHTQKLPPKILLKHFDALDQGQLGSCASHATVQALRIIAQKKDQPTDLQSRLFDYYATRTLEGTVDQDSGCTLRDVMKVLNKTGTTKETLWPYDLTRFKEKPPQSVYRDAVKHLVASYHRINTLQDARSCLASGYPFIFGVMVYDSFMYSQQAQTTGVIPMPDVNNEELLGGHALVCIGYDDEKKYLTFQNSWGMSWGDKGLGYLPYLYFQNPDLTDDMWTWL